MRFSVIAIAAMLVLPLAAAPGQACSGAKVQGWALAATADLSAQTKKPAKKAGKAKKEKVEYMRAAPMK
jgi:hypothetical protein